MGCGRGEFLQVAKERGWEVYGTEFSPKAIELCEAKGLKMTRGSLNSDSFDPEMFDVFTSFEVLEHINNPLEETALFYKFLRKGGLFYCTTPNFNAYLRYYLKADYNIIEYPEHLSYYTRKTLRRMVKKQGFKPIKILTTGISITRLKTSQKTSDEKYISGESSDEKLRQKIAQKGYLQTIKKLANFTLTVFGLGMTLKGYFEKK